MGRSAGGALPCGASGGEISTVGSGTIVFVPRNVVHRFKNVGATTACMLDWSLPGGQDHYFKAIADLAAGGGFTDDEVMEINKRFNTDFPQDSDTRGTAAYRE